MIGLGSLRSVIDGVFVLGLMEAVEQLYQTKVRYCFYERIARLIRETRHLKQANLGTCSFCETTGWGNWEHAAASITQPDTDIRIDSGYGKRRNWGSDGCWVVEDKIIGSTETAASALDGKLL